jgi:thiamine biosynthesis protein ThiC
MGGMKRVLLLIVIMTAVASGVAFITLHALYQAAFEQQRERLTETVQSRTRLLEAILRHEEEESPLIRDRETTHGGSVEVMLGQVRAWW